MELQLTDFSLFLLERIMFNLKSLYLELLGLVIIDKSSAMLCDI